MDKSKNIADKKNCFIIMPFSKAKINDDRFLDQKSLTHIYSYIIKKAVENYRKGKRKVFEKIHRNESQIGSIISNIVGHLNQYDLVIADLTGLNPNVMYELGVRHSLRRGTIILTQDTNYIPSDLRDYMLVKYSYTGNTVEDADNYKVFEADLHRAIDEIFTTDKVDSPVLSYLQGKQFYWNEDQLKTFWHNRIVYEFICDNYDELSGYIAELKKNNPDDPIPSILISVLGTKISNIYSGIRDLRISAEAPDLYEDIIASENMMEILSKEISMSTSVSDLFGNIPLPPEAKALFDRPRSIGSILFKQYFNPFIFSETEVPQITFEEIFSEDKEFETSFLGPLEVYLDSKARELNISEEQIAKKLNYSEEE